MSRFPFRFIGILLVSWSGLNTYLDISRYSLAWGSYWWFCNLALFGMGVGLLLKSRGVITGFLSIACFTQIFWLIDNAHRQLMGRSLFGLVDFMYRPGYPTDEFLLNHYHYFTIPIAIASLFFLPQKKSNTLPLIAFFNPFIFAVSYFAFPAQQNVNCIHHACFPTLTHLQGPLYSLIFWAVIFAVHLAIGFFLENIFLNLKLNPAVQQRAFTGFLCSMVVATGFAVHDTFNKVALPSFSCANTIEVEGVKVGCQMTHVHHDGQFMLTYFAENTSDSPQHCEINLLLNDKLETVNDGLSISVGQKAVQNVLLEVPNQDTIATWKPHCKKTI